jgi:hypothetical protein
VDRACDCGNSLELPSDRTELARARVSRISCPRVLRRRARPGGRARRYPHGSSMIPGYRGARASRSQRRVHEGSSPASLVPVHRPSPPAHGRPGDAWTLAGRVDDAGCGRRGPFGAGFVPEGTPDATLILASEPPGGHRVGALTFIEARRLSGLPIQKNSGEGVYV